MVPFRMVRWPLLAHVVLGAFALLAWLEGPFLGAGVVDGAETLELARSGRMDIVTKSPLHPWALGALFHLFGDSPWTTGLLGLSLSAGTLWVAAALAARLAGARAAGAAAWLYAVSGSAYCFLVQPLPEPMAALLLGSAVLVLLPLREGARGRRAVLQAFLGGILLGAGAFTRAPLMAPAALLLPWALSRAGVRGAGAVLGGLALATALCMAAFGERAWPEGSALNLRLGNGAERSGFSDLRPGPAYDQFRYQAVFDQPDDRALRPEADHHRDRLREEIVVDPSGAALTVLRKAHLTWHRTEIVTSADFRHGLGGFPPLPALLLSFGLVAPLALLSLRAGRPGPPWLAVLGVTVACTAFMTGARYRFPMLPILCALGAGELLRWREWRRPRVAAALAVLLLACNLNPWSLALAVPGDGLVQEAWQRMLRERTDPRGRQAAEAALQVGQDPRAAFLLGLWHESAGDPAAAVAAYDRALALCPLYAEAAENRLRATVARSGFGAEASAFARAWMERIPRAGLLWLNVAELDRGLPDAERTRLRGEGHRRMALRHLAQGQLERAREHAELARGLGVRDARLAALAR